MTPTNQEIEDYYNSTRAEDVPYLKIHHIPKTLVKEIAKILKNRNKTLILNS